MAFLKGISIQESVLLMYEVLYSFILKEYNESVFALKADLFKAFDILGWSFFRLVMQGFGFPLPLTNLIMSCVTCFKFSIKLNDVTSGGFIKPEWGLRQSCPLSPYLFILSMEVLLRMLSRAQIEGRLKGIQLVDGALPITHNLYADDLVLFGLTDEREMSYLAEITDNFGKMSELEINEEKLVIWF
jgi:Reverse transcriptase (RNA-dependent DNA polymerase)